MTLLWYVGALGDLPAFHRVSNRRHGARDICSAAWLRSKRPPGLDPSADGKALSVAIDRTAFPIAFAQDGDVIVNFGILSGREATQAEVDRLALGLRRLAPALR